ncbi:uncharacterized protein VTP21DRAFT_587 [Calcarisporiella thermophila]|uniref:uncharacterized protein n=1 Tax=Calcarisporiella thermophila TaxID=911321 RepID=UPI003743D569
MPFGQLVIGPPGSGKTTYCHGMYQLLNSLGRTCSIVNLDPANDFLPYPCDVNISDLITVEDTMESLGLGPNGGMMYCMEFLERNFDWLEEELNKLKGDYVIFDCPGQVEFFTHHSSLKNIIDRLQKLNHRLVAVHLVDAHYCTDPAKYISVLLLSLKTMIQLELPHVNVLSKIDLVESYGKLAFNLDFYTEVLDLSYLLQHLNQDPFARRYADLNRALCELIEDFGLVSFYTLCVEDKESIVKLLRAIDKAGGYIFGGLTQGNESIMAAAVQVGMSDDISRAQEKYIDFPELYRSWEEKGREGEKHQKKESEELDRNRANKINPKDVYEVRDVHEN